MGLLERHINSFHQKYKVSESGCWEWTAARFTSGYGALNPAFKRHGLSQYAHRTSWIIHHGPILEGLLVCHKCDNPGCVNPQHLFLGTYKDNMQDALKKGRIRPGPPRGPRRGRARGETHGRAKLTETQVREIRVDTRPQQKIADDYGVSQMQICRIKRGELWEHVK